MHRDTVIGIVGVVILVAAMVGVFTYERGVAAGVTPIGGSFALAELDGPSLSGTADLGDEAVETLAIEQANMTRITFTLTWTPGQTSSDTLQLLVAPANGTGLTNGTQSAEEDDGEITVTLDIPNEEPTSGPRTLGVGDYEVTVRFVSAAPPGPLGPAPLPVTDSTVRWSLATTLQAYEPTDTAGGDDS